MPDQPTLTRRELLARGAALAGAATVAPGAEALAAAEPRARVVVVTTKAPMSPEKPPSLALVEAMLETGVTALASKSDPIQAWGAFLRKGDTVALPTAGGQLENMPEVNAAVYRALARFGVNRMVVGTHRMSGQWLTRVKAGVGEHMPELVIGKLFGIADVPMDALVVTPTVKHHDIAGLSGTLKLYAAFSKKGPWNYHGEVPRYSDHWDGAVGGGMGACGWVPANDFKTARKLHVVDLLRVGTGSRGWTAWPDTWVYTKALVLSTDPVAADRVAFDLYLKVGQASGRIDPFHHVERADTEYHAGVSDLRRIDIKRVVV